MIQPTLINLLGNKYTQGLRYFPFAVHLDRYVGSCNTLNDLSNAVFVPNKGEDLNLHVFNMMIEVNESKTLTKHILYKYECGFGGKICNSNQNWKNDKCLFEYKNPEQYHMCKK